MISNQTPTMTPQELKTWLKAPGPQLAQTMRRVTAPEHLDEARNILSEWEIGFVTSVAEKSKKFRDSLTEKQRAVALRIMSKPQTISFALRLMAEDEASELAIERFPQIANSPAVEATVTAATADAPLDDCWGSF